MPALTEALGFAVGKGAGYEADDFLAARPPTRGRTTCSSPPPTATRFSS